MRLLALLVSFFFLAYVLALSSAAQCGEQNQGLPCPGGLCCSKWGFCGTTADYCLPENGCQMNCTGGDDGGGDDDDDPVDGGALGEILSREMFDAMLPYRNDSRCYAVNFYRYSAFIEAAKSYPAFAATGDEETRKREVAAFLGQTSHETTGGWPTAPGGPYSWGYCFNEEIGCPVLCQPDSRYPCVPGQSYCGRGPIQLSWNYNYGQFGESIGRKDELLQNPTSLKTNATLSFESALWFWMTPQSPKPSCHDVITGAWVPSPEDIAAGRIPGYGMITNIINGGLECGSPGPDARVEDRIGFFKRYCDMLGVGYGSDKLDCYNMRPYGFRLADSM
ncbi:PATHOGENESIS-RELATED 3, basic chitinase [Hibiscus trionum]|uniref:PATHOGENESIS-RELATED 3, basic chitinase n=1 Tax=Hibiscus trionum TaxID=183268 RepID=A0A9W7JC45_HIBTR|nr:PATHOGENESIS-RELATED 3, basic chitinase [Hibiscus trionum]